MEIKMNKLLITFILLFSSVVESASENEIYKTREGQYVLKLNKILENHCHLLIYENKNHNHFALLKMEKSDIENTDFFVKDRKNYISKNAVKYSYNKLFKEDTKSHRFGMIDGDLIMNYLVINNNGSTTSKEVILFEKIRCK